MFRRASAGGPQPPPRRRRQAVPDPVLVDVSRSREAGFDAGGRAVDRWPRRRARALRAERIRVGATSAVRDVSNRDELEEAVRRTAGSELEVITGEQEAALSFLGATRGLDAPSPFLVLDIGGGSTEFVVGEGA